MEFFRSLGCVKASGLKTNCEGNINQYDPQSYLFNRESFHASRKGKKTPNSGYYLIHFVIALFPFNRTAARALQVSLRVLTSAKLIFLTLNGASLLLVWHHSHKHMEGLIQIVGLERNGFI